MTTIMQEAKKTTTDTSSGKEQMRSFKHLRETFGRKNAEKIRERKKQQELTRDVVAEPKPWWFAHPEAGDDPAAGHVQQIIITGYNDNNNNIYIYLLLLYYLHALSYVYVQGSITRAVETWKGIPLRRERQRSPTHNTLEETFLNL